MHLNEYIAQCLEFDLYPTAPRLTIPRGDLLTRMRNLRGISELEGLEHGFNLYWEDRYASIVCGPQIAGLPNGTAVSLNAGVESRTPTYIGDCHTHPYRLKMGPNVHVGPSNGDWTQWRVYPPSAFNVGVHLVVSGATVFLVMQRPASQVRGQEYHFGEAGENADLLQAYFGHQELQDLIDDARETAEVDRRRGFMMERDAWTMAGKPWSGVPQTFVARVREMNIHVSNTYHFEFYIGSMDDGTQAAPCTLLLQSHPVYP